EISDAVHSTLAAIRARRSSIPSGRNCSNSGDELRSSLNALKNYVNEQTTSFYRQNNRSSVRESPINSVKQHIPTQSFNSTRWKSERFPEYMSRLFNGTFVFRSYSPIRPRPNTYNTKLSKHNSISTDMLLSSPRFPSNSNINNLYENVKSHVLGQIIRNSPIPANICERQSSGRLLSIKERTLRHHSRQHKLALESDSSSDIEKRTKLRKRRLRKRQRKKSNDEDK
ncbi:unnamed protein product, partial [Onchocerca flexuosa]|uniref:BZIP domain-containing protein n=1 Tax=Onchocerca flexuosa TaxID=387005 RepID=A0A183HRX0_9BILA